MSTPTTIKLPGVDLPVVRRGKGRPMLLLHGGGGPVVGLPFADRLAERFELIAPIHPGFMGTKVPEHVDSIDDLKFIYLDMMDALDLRDAVVVGFSMGGWVAAELAVMTTARMARLVLVDAVGIKPGGREDRDIADVFGTPADKLARIMWHNLANAPKPAEMSDQALAMMASNREALGIYTWQPYMHNPKLKHRLHRIGVPTLLLWGESDGLVTPAYGEAYRKLIPGAQLVVIPEAGHAPHIEQTDAFVRHLVSFVS
ncbi:MAG: alpha/beta hydrolase [Alphaproteobacteria bacterium]|nr:alpha/beta hydrolase [Alphaproteobacteria bacterium]